MQVELDIEIIEQLLAYLRAQNHIGANETPRCAVLAGGVSNRTVLVERAHGQAWVLKQALAKLRVQADWFSDPARVHREAMGLRWLAQLAPAGSITPLVFEDHQHHLLAMQAVPLPHHNWKQLLLRGQLAPDHVRQFGTLLGQVHRLSAQRRDQVAHIFADWRFFESLRLEPYYGYAAAQVPAARAFLQQLIADTRSQRLALVHGDYSPKNVLVHQDRLILLDHEVIHFGDPAFDVGFGLTHLLSKAHHLPAWRGAFAEAALSFYEHYRQALGEHAWAGALEARAVRHTLGCLLARVAGRSPLEYLTPETRQHQQQVVVGLMQEPPLRLQVLVNQFVQGLERHVAD